MEDNLPVLKEEPSAMEKLRQELARRDGYLSPSNACVPEEASDVGDEIHDNPTAQDLGYRWAEVKDVVEFQGKTYLADGDVGPTAEIGINSGDFIEDVTDWA